MRQLLKDNICTTCRLIWNEPVCVCLKEINHFGKQKSLSRGLAAPSWFVVNWFKDTTNWSFQSECDVNSPTLLLDPEHCETRSMTTSIIKVLKQKAEKHQRVEERLQAETQITFGRKPASTLWSTRKHPDRPSHPVMSSNAPSPMSHSACESVTGTVSERTVTFRWKLRGICIHIKNQSPDALRETADWNHRSEVSWQPLPRI